MEKITNMYSIDDLPRHGRGIAWNKAIEKEMIKQVDFCTAKQAKDRYGFNHCGSSERAGLLICSGATGKLFRFGQINYYTIYTLLPKNNKT